MVAIRRITPILLALCMLLGSMGLSGCASKPPALEDVYDRLVYVIEESLEINTVIFGEGLPVYERDSEIAELTHMYYSLTQTDVEMVIPGVRYSSIEQIQTAMARVYSQSYRESLDTMLFTGYADTDAPTAVLAARYSEDAVGLYQTEGLESMVKGVRTYDYASMTILDSSNAKRLNVSIRSYTDENPGQWETRQLVFVYENGNWYLDSPSC